MVTDFLTPDTSCQYTHPPELKKEIESLVGEYILDVRDFRSGNKEKILADIYEMTRKRFQLARHLLAKDDWDYFIMVEMGTDRIHHGFWKDMDAAHRKHVPGGAYEQAILDYHVHVDGLLANLLRHADDETAVLVVSDHGAKRMDGGIRINEWLRQEGLLELQREPEGRSSTRDCGIDWSRTKVWAEGGYYSRVFLNVEGREPEGTIPAADYERFRDELIERISAIPDDQGRPIPTRVFRPEDVYPEIKGVAPDLIVHFGDLYWRAVGTVGGDEGIYTFDNDTGPDDANHAQHGMFILRAPGVEPGLREGAHLLDVAPTVLELLGQPVPPAMRGASLLERVTA
jgi:predicted AlkP superfamily phosphohydrolase/phosphomutase